MNFLQISFMDNPVSDAEVFAVVVQRLPKKVKISMASLQYVVY
jgi:hypothetical protein